MLTTIRRRLAVLAVLALVILSIASGCKQGALPPDEAAEESILRTTSIDGFKLIRVRSMEHSARQAFFIGPPTADPLPLIHVENFTLGAREGNISTATEEELYDSIHVASDGYVCGVFVFRLRDGKKPPDESGFSSRQLHDLAGGKATMLDVQASCGAG